jgi:hypothetical protein
VRGDRWTAPVPAAGGAGGPKRSLQSRSPHRLAGTLLRELEHVPRSVVRVLDPEHLAERHLPERHGHLGLGLELGERRLGVVDL